MLLKVTVLVPALIALITVLLGIPAVVEVTELDIERNRVSLSTKVNNQEGTEVIRGDALVMVEELQEDS